MISLLIYPYPKGSQEKNLAVPFKVQGKNRQIFQMCQSILNKVKELI